MTTTTHVPSPTRRPLALLLAASLALAPVATSRVAHAEPTKAELDAARKKFQAALELEKTGKWDEALKLLREVEAVKVTSQVLFHIALSLENTGKLVAARDTYLKAREEAETREGAEGLTMQKKSTERLADLEGRIPKVIVQVPEDVVSAKVSIDGKEPVSALVSPELLLDPGPHEIVVTAPGRKTFTQKLVLKEKDAPVTLKPTLAFEDDHPEAAPAAPAPVTTPSKPAAPKVYVDRSSAGMANALPYVVGGLGVVALATAGTMYGLRASTISDLDAQCGPDRASCPRSAKSIEDSGRTYATLGNVFLGVGVVAIGTAVVLIVTKKPKTEQPTISLADGPTPLGIGVVGRF